MIKSVKIKIFSENNEVFNNNCEKKKSRKKKRNTEQWKRNKAAALRSKGEEYVSQKGVIVPAKSVNLDLLCTKSCRFKCSTTIDTETRILLFNSFYKMEINVKNTYLFKSIRQSETSRVTKNPKKVRSYTYQYFVKKIDTDIRVCKTAFCEIFQIGRKKVELLQKQIKIEVFPQADKRGKHLSRPHKMSDEVMQYIVSHIESFPSESSHYSRNNNPNRKYLSPLLNISKMFSLYKQKCVDDNKPECYSIKDTTYRKIFCQSFNLNFGNPRSDTCSRCDAGESNNTEHVSFYKAAYETQRKDRELAINNHKICYITMDLQQTMPLPKLSTSKAFYLRQLWFYNFGIHAITVKGHQPYMFTWTEDLAGKGSNEIASSLWYFVQLSKNTTLQDVDHLVVWSDSCAGQNKNFNIISLYQYMILKGDFKIIDHKFPEVGHSYLDSDRDFGRIEKILRKNQNIYTPEQYRSIIKDASKKNVVLVDMEHQFKKVDILKNKLRIVNKVKNTEGEKINFRDNIKWIRVDTFGSYKYKESYDEDVPFKTVNLLKDKGFIPTEVILERLNEKIGDISKEKIDNLKAQLAFVPLEFQWFYEQLF